MDWFSVLDCSFVVHKSKETTGRVVMFREFGVKNSYTMEGSFCGPTKGLHKDTHFSQKLLVESGRQFGRALFKFSDAAHVKDALREVEILTNGHKNRDDYLMAGGKA